MLPQEVIVRKRDGATLSADEIRFMVEGLTAETISEGQAAAFAMAIFFLGLDLDERVALTRAMSDSGSVLGWDEPWTVTAESGPQPPYRSSGSLTLQFSLRWKLESRGSSASPRTETFSGTA